MGTVKYQAIVECKASSSTQTKTLTFTSPDKDFSGKSTDELNSWALPKVKDQNKSALKGFSSVRVTRVSKLSSGSTKGKKRRGLLSRIFGIADSFLGD